MPCSVLLDFAFPVIDERCNNKADSFKCPVKDIKLHGDNIHLCSPSLGILAQSLSFSVLIKNGSKDNQFIFQS